MIGIYKYVDKETNEVVYVGKAINMTKQVNKPVLLFCKKQIDRRKDSRQNDQSVAVGIGDYTKEP